MELDERISTRELDEDAKRFFAVTGAAGAAGSKQLEIDYAGTRFTLALPPLGEGDRGMVYEVLAHELPIPPVAGRLCVKVAKGQPFCRERLLEEEMTTAFFGAEGVSVPRIHFMDPEGRFALKDLVEGEPVTSLYLRHGELSVTTQALVLTALEAFLLRLLALFRRRPRCQVSLSPNNIYLRTEQGRVHDPMEFVLIDPGTTLNKDYRGFSFAKYWNEMLPDRIRKYQRNGYLRWLVPRELTDSGREQAKRARHVPGRRTVRGLAAARGRLHHRVRAWRGKPAPCRGQTERASRTGR